MKLPRRQPRAVYEVYDAEEPLDEHAQPASRACGASASEQESAQERLQRSTPAHPSLRGHGRMLVGALLCLTIGAAATAIAVVALRPDGHTAKGLKHTDRKPAASVSTTTHRPFVRHASTAMARAAEEREARTRLAVPRLAVPRATRIASPVPPHPTIGPETEDYRPVLAPASVHGQGMTLAECECTAAEVEFGFER